MKNQGFKTDTPYIRDGDKNRYHEISKAQAGLLLLTGSNLLYEFDGNRMIPMKRK